MTEPTPAPPSSTVARAATRTGARTAVAAAAVAGLAAAFVGGYSLAGDGGPSPDDRRVVAALPGTARVSWAGSLGTADSCADLLGWYVDRGADLVGPWGWGYGDDSVGGGRGPMMFNSSEDGADATAGRTSPESAEVTRATSSATGTNVQEAGVDEPDVVKTDGEVLLRVEDGALVVHDVTGADVRRVGSLTLEGMGEDAELLLAGETVVVLGHDAEAEPGREGTRVLVLDLSDPDAPRVVRTATYDAPLASARLHGDTVRLVLRSGLPHLDFVQPRAWRGQETALEKNRAAVRRSTIEDWLPRVSVDGGAATQAVDCGAVALPRDDDAGLGTLTVVGFTADDPTRSVARGLAVDTDLTYFSADRMYVATTPWSWGCCWIADDLIGPELEVWPPRPVPSPGRRGTSAVHEFALDGLETRYTASGEVDGRIADRWSMDEHDGVLRLAVGATEATGNFNSVVTLTREGDRLVETGRLDRLGVNEQIESVRWFDDLAIVVTFRRIDPLYAIDLTDTDRPTLLGELKIPGFSEYLHPLGSQRLVGIGQGPTGPRGARGWGAQVGLFDTSDLTDVTRLDVLSYGDGTVALAGADPRQVTWLPAERTLLTVISSGYGARTGSVSVLRLDGGTLTNRMVEVEHGYDVDLVRLVPLPDGRVVLVTGDDASFFEV